MKGLQCQRGRGSWAGPGRLQEALVFPPGENLGGLCIEPSDLIWSPEHHSAGGAMSLWAARDKLLIVIGSRFCPWE